MCIELITWFVNELIGSLESSWTFRVYPLHVLFFSLTMETLHGPENSRPYAMGLSALAL
jgi:hypothetical protein